MLRQKLTTKYLKKINSKFKFASYYKNKLMLQKGHLTLGTGDPWKFKCTNHLNLF